MRITRRAALVFAVLSLTLPMHAQSHNFDPAPWLADFHQFLSEMSSHYAGLEWALNDRHMDLPKLRAETEKKLENARNDAEARHIFEKFLNSFGDGHLEIDWPDSDAQPSPDKQSGELCERLGYKPRSKPGIDFSQMSGFTSLSSKNFFAAGLLALPSGKKIGVIRIGDFGETGFPAACEHAVQQLGFIGRKNCDDKCSDEVGIHTANLLTTAINDRAEELRRAGARALLIDITHNGGGSDWVEAVARELSSKPLLASRMRMLFVKHPHWTIQLEHDLKEVQADIANHRQPGHLLQTAAAELQKAIAASEETCNRASVWTAGKLNCTALASGYLYTSGLLSYARPGSLAGLESRSELFHPAQYVYTESKNRLPLYVLVDHNTWSAAEEFAAILQDNKAAIVIGELTGGAGCGYTNGGIPTTLMNSKATVKMPDCVRLRADGSDEVNGITPDILVPWAQRDSDYQRARKLYSALEKLR